MKIGSFEGNIGAGKSTLVRIVEDHQDIFKEAGFTPYFLYEPIDDWRDVGGENLLENFYTDQTKYAFAFQAWVFLTRCKRLEELIDSIPEEERDNALILVERSRDSDRHCFSQIMREEGALTDAEHHMYKFWFDWLTTKAPQVDSFIFLDVSPETCFARVAERSRDEENSLTLEYLEKLDMKHRLWLKGEKCLVIPAEENYLNNPDRHREIVQDIVRHFKK